MNSVLRSGKMIGMGNLICVFAVTHTLAVRDRRA